MSGSSTPSSSFYAPEFDYNNYYREVLEQITTNLSNTLETFGPSSLQYQTILETLKSCLRILDALETPASPSQSSSSVDTAMEIETETLSVHGQDQGLSQQQQRGDGKGDEGREGKVMGLDVDPDLLSLAMEFLRIGDGVEVHGRRKGWLQVILHDTVPIVLWWVFSIHLGDQGVHTFGLFSEQHY